MSPGDEVQSPEDALSPPSGEGPPLSRGDLDSSPEPGGRSPQAGPSAPGTRRDAAGRKSSFLQTLLDAEAAAHAAAIQLVSFKDAMEDELANFRPSGGDQPRVARQRGLLLGRLEDFRRVNKSVRQRLKLLQEAEADRIEAGQQIDLLQKKIAQSESQNERLKEDLSQSEKRVMELMELRREEQENAKTAAHATKCAEATRAHLQGQLRHKEAENNRLSVQLRELERTVTRQKMEMDDLRASVIPLATKAARDKESLKKATRAQKLRAERFEAAVEKCYAQLRDKDAQLTEAHAEREARRRQAEETMDERDRLAAHVDALKSQIEEMTARLQKEREELTDANATGLRRVEQLAGANAELREENAALKDCMAQLELQLANCEAALVEEKSVAEELKRRGQRSQDQVAQLQAEIHDLRAKCRNLSQEMEKTEDGKQTEVEKVRLELQPRVDELRGYPGLLSAIARTLSGCRQSLRRSERACAEKAESVRKLQVQAESRTELLRSSAEMKESVQEANVLLRENLNSLQKTLESQQQENLELVRRLAAQEEALSYSNRQLDQRSAECQALSRQLEAALADVRQQVGKVKEQAECRGGALQTRVQELEAERGRREQELRDLRRSKVTAERNFEARLKDLQLSLDQSESHKRSIQNYVDFLKNSYQTMFDEGLQASLYGSSCFLK